MKNVKTLCPYLDLNRTTSWLLQTKASNKYASPLLLFIYSRSSFVRAACSTAGSQSSYETISIVYLITSYFVLYFWYDIHLSTTCCLDDEEDSGFAHFSLEVQCSRQENLITQ